MQTLGLSDYGRENIIEFSRMAEFGHTIVDTFKK